MPATTMVAAAAVAAVIRIHFFVVISVPFNLCPAMACHRRGLLPGVLWQPRANLYNNFTNPGRNQELRGYGSMSAPVDFPGGVWGGVMVTLKASHEGQELA